MGLREEWEKALSEVEPENNLDALTISELRVLWDCTEDVAIGRMRRLVKSGRAQKTQKRLPGQRMLPAYLLIPKRK